MFFRVVTDKAPTLLASSVAAVNMSYLDFVSSRAEATSVNLLLSRVVTVSAVSRIFSPTSSVLLTKSSPLSPISEYKSSVSEAIFFLISSVFFCTSEISRSISVIASSFPERKTGDIQSKSPSVLFVQSACSLSRFLTASVRFFSKSSSKLSVSVNCVLCASRVAEATCCAE